MQTPRVSVVIPTRNRRGLIGFALQSVLDQSYRDLEVLVVDDGSSDGTEAFIRDLEVPRVRYLRSHGRGIGAAMNTAIRAARGELIARLDSDDVWLPDLLAIEVAELDARPEAAMVYARGQAIDTAGKPLDHIQGSAERYPGETFRSMLYDDFTCNITTVARREALESVGLYDESLRGNEDWDIWLRVARCHPFAFVDRILARFRWHEGNLTGLTSQDFEKVVEGRSLILDKVFATDDLPLSIDAMKPIAYRNVYTFAGLRFLQTRNYRKASSYFQRAVRHGRNPAVAALRILWFAGFAGLLGRPAIGLHLSRASRWVKAAGRRLAGRGGRRE